MNIYNLSKVYKLFIGSFVRAIVVICLFTHAIACAHQDKTIKHVIGANKEHGLFAGFFNVLSGILWSFENYKIPVVYWDQESPYYQSQGYNNRYNVWEYYFEPITSMSYKPGDKIERSYHYPNNNLIRNIFHVGCHKSGRAPARELIKELLINQYIRVKPAIKAKVDDFSKKNMQYTYTIGLHLRGTDKATELINKSLNELCTLANTHADNVGKKCQFFVATDEQVLLDQAKKLLNRSVIAYPAHRSATKQALHFTSGIPKAVLGEEVLIEALLLSRCNLLIHTCSNVTSAVLCFNPYLRNIVASPVKYMRTAKKSRIVTSRSRKRKH